MFLFECDSCGESFDSPDDSPNGEACNRCDDGIMQMIDEPEGEQDYHEE